MAIKNINRPKLRRVFAVLGLSALTFTISSCSSAKVPTLDENRDYLTVGDYKITQGELWNELQWSAVDLLDQKEKEAVLSKYITDIKTVMADKTNENYKHYQARLQNYMIEKIYGFEFSLEDHNDAIADLSEKERKSKARDYANNLYLEEELPEGVTTDKIIDAILEAAKTNNYDIETLNSLLKFYYTDLAQELLAKEKLAEEIKEKNDEYANDDDDETIGYFSKSEIVTKYKSDYLHQGDVETIMIRFNSEDEATNTLKAFGIKAHNNKLYYLTNTTTGSSNEMSFSKFKQYYDDFDFSTAKDSDYIDLNSVFGDSFILQLYIYMYNYVYTYRSETGLDNAGFILNDSLDQRSATERLINYYRDEDIVTDETSDDDRIEEIMTNIREDDNQYGTYVNYTAEELKDIDSSLYSYLYSTLSTPINDENKEEIGIINDDYTRFSTSPYSVGNYYYMAYKVKQDKTEDDKIFDNESGVYDSKSVTDLSSDEVYEKIIATDKDGSDDLYDRIITDLENEDLTSTYITEKLDAELENVKIKIYNEAIEIGYATKHDDYSKTLSKAPNTNTLAEFTYNGTTTPVYLVTPEDDKDNVGLYNILEYRQGASTAVNLISKKMIKDSQAYKDIKQDDIDAYYKTIEYMLAIFANDGLSQSGYPASIGKYNFLMLYYHTSDIDKIVEDTFMVSNASTKLLTDYSSAEIVNLFKEYSDKAYNNFFSVNTTNLQVFIDKDEDGKPDSEAIWTPELKNSAKELIKVIYDMIESNSSDHKTALTSIVEKYNSAGRFNLYEGDQYPQPGSNPDNPYDPIGYEWIFSKYKNQGLAITTSDITVTNTSTDVELVVKDYISGVYNDNFKGKEIYPNQLLLDPNDPTNIIEVKKDGTITFNYYVITGAEKPASAKYEGYKDVDGIFKNLYYMYNNNLITVDNVYNNEYDTLTEDQIKAYILEYNAFQTSNLLPSDISTAITNFLNPVYTRYTSDVTQTEIILNYVSKNGDISFADNNTKVHFEESRKINKDKADGYLSDEEQKYNNFEGWFDAIKDMNGGNA